MEKRGSFDPTTPSSVDGPPQAAPQGVQSSQMYAQPVVITIYIPDTTSEVSWIFFYYMLSIMFIYGMLFLCDLSHGN